MCAFFPRLPPFLGTECCLHSSTKYHQSCQVALAVRLLSLSLSPRPRLRVAISDSSVSGSSAAPCLSVSLVSLKSVFYCR